MTEQNDGLTTLLGRRRVLQGLAATVGLVATAKAVPAWAARMAAPAAWPLWSVEGKTGKCYLLGETPPRTAAWHDARIESLLPRCATLWTETSQLRRADPGELVKRFGADANKPLTAWLTADDQARLAKAADYCRMPMDSLAQFRPWLAGASLQEAYYRVAGLSTDSADRVLVAQASKHGVAVSSEFPAQDDVFAWFGAMSPAQDVQFLRYSLDEILAGPKQNELIYADWAAGRAGRATAVMRDMQQKSPELFQKIAVQRNHDWLPRFNAMLAQDKPALVVVGLYHLVGPASLLGQLEHSGLTVRRL